MEKKENDLTLLFNGLIADIAYALKPKGFVRKGKSIKFISNDTALIIETQKSDRSSKDCIIFTINLGVIHEVLLDKERVSIDKATVADAHLQTRLGVFLNIASDFWWSLNAKTDYDSLKKELLELLFEKAVPYLEMYKNKLELIALWESGRSPGLTAVQRSRFLAVLKAEAD